MKDNDVTAGQIRTGEEVYQFVERLKSTCQEEDALELFKKLDNAMRLGSSALEILGAIRQTLTTNRAEIERLLGPGGNEEVDRVVAFVDTAFGR